MFVKLERKFRDNERLAKFQNSAKFRQHFAKFRWAKFRINACGITLLLNTDTNRGLKGTVQRDF
jgi:hypothetical protein